MAKKPKRKQSIWSKYVAPVLRGVVKGTFVTAGTVVATAPIIDAGQKNFVGGKFNFKGFSEQIQRNYGRDPFTGTLDLGKTITNGVVLPVIGVGIMMIGGAIANRIR